MAGQAKKSKSVANDGPNFVDVHVGNRIRLRRKTLGMSQETLAEGIALTFQQVQKYEKGSNRVSASKLYEAAMVLKVPPAYFFEGLPNLDGTEVSADTTIEQNVHEFLRSTIGFELVESFNKLSLDLRRSFVNTIRETASALGVKG